MERHLYASKWEGQRLRFTRLEIQRAAYPYKGETVIVELMCGGVYFPVKIGKTFDHYFVITIIVRKIHKNKPQRLT